MRGRWDKKEWKEVWTADKLGFDTLFVLSCQSEVGGRVRGGQEGEKNRERGVGHHKTKTQFEKQETSFFWRREDSSTDHRSRQEGARNVSGKRATKKIVKWRKPRQKVAKDGGKWHWLLHRHNGREVERQVEVVIPLLNRQLGARSLDAVSKRCEIGDWDEVETREVNLLLKDQILLQGLIIPYILLLISIYLVQLKFSILQLSQKLLLKVKNRFFDQLTVFPI